MYDYDDRILKTIPRTTKIVCYCKNHPNVKYRTKNIGCIGARTLFLDDTTIPECDCPISDIVVDKEESEKRAKEEG